MAAMTGRDNTAGDSGSHLDAATLFYELGREVQAVGLLMRRHRLIDSQQLCACGRVPVRTLPYFGIRCDVAGERWARTDDAMRRILARGERTSPRRVQDPRS